MRVYVAVFILVVATLYIFNGIHAFDAKSFKTCSEYTFCTNLRSGAVQNSAKYSILNESIQKNKQTGHLEFILESKNDFILLVNDFIKNNKESNPKVEIGESNVESTQQEKLNINDLLPKSVDNTYLYPKQLFDRIQVEISHFSGVFRFQFKEENNNRKTAVEDVIIQKSNEFKFKEDEDFIILSSDDAPSTYIKVSKKDFKVEQYQNGHVSIVFNQNQFLYVDSKKVESLLKQDVGETISDSIGNFKLGTVYGDIGGASSFDTFFPGAKHVYGIPERSATLSLPHTVDQEPFRLFNADVFRYDLDNAIGLYGSIPLLFSLTSSGEASGIFALNPSNTFVDIDKKKENGISTRWMHEVGLLDLFFIPGPSPKEVLNKYIKLTGTPMLPQQFSLGYHQCRWNYKDQEDVFQVNNNFNKYDIPYDVLWLDIEHTDGKKYFTWDKSSFPTPLEMQKNLKNDGRKLVTISDPHIKVEKGYFVYEEAEKNQYFVKDSQGKSFEGNCWPGKSSWVDFFNPEARKWYASLYSFNKYQGSTDILYTWIDMNEPSVFNSPEITMPPDNLHFGGKTHREVHNLYGFYHGMATNLGHQLRRNGEDRPFVLTRSFFSGSQRYVSAWTGDNIGNWDHLKKTVSMLLSVSISGFPFIGSDVGGFFDNPEEELLIRWYQSGAFYPFFRAHAHIETKRREMWLFGENPLRIMREAVIQRYILLPYYYSLAFEASVTGQPIMRPLFFEFSTEDKLHSEENQFLIGSGLLVAPVTEKNQKEKSVIFPSNTLWYHWKDGSPVSISSSQIANVKTPLDYIPVFQRGGSIIPTQYRVRRSSLAMKNDPFTLRIALSANRDASGFLYYDDGFSYKYKSGQYLVRNFITKPVNQQLLITSRAGELKHAEALPNKNYAQTVLNTIERIIISGITKKPTKIYIEKQLNDATLTDVNVLLHFSFDEQNRVLTIKKPNVLIHEDWDIVVE